MPAPKGNKFWEMRSSHGRKPTFAKPDDLWDAAIQYFEWVAENPLEAAELVKYQGEAKVQMVPKMRAMTIDGMCIFIDISHNTWCEYCKKEDFREVTTRIDRVIRTQKFEGAAAELLNPNIIARDLGMADRQEHTGKDGKPIEHAIVDAPPAFNTIDDWVEWKKRHDKDISPKGDTD